MTEHDLATLLRNHVANEPPYGHVTAAEVLSGGRRKVRRTRLAIAGSVAAVLVVAAVGVPQLFRGPAGPPTVAAALESYDARAMPETMDEHARLILDSSVPDLGEPDFVAFDSQMQELPEEHWDKASGMVLRYGLDSPHRVNITMTHAWGQFPGDPEGRCTQDLKSGIYLECTVERTASGDVVVTTLSALDLDSIEYGGLQAWQSDTWMVVRADDIESAPSAHLWFAQEVQVMKAGSPETFKTVVTEIVEAPDLATARERLVVPPEDLAEIGLEPVFVMPVPPGGENGCPLWSMGQDEMRCTG